MILWEVLQWPGIWREGIKGGRGEGRKVRRGRRGEEKNRGREMMEGRRRKGGERENRDKQRDKMRRGEGDGMRGEIFKGKMQRSH